MSKFNSAQGTGELKSRLIFVVVAILVFRLGVYIPIPNIDPTKLVDIISKQGSSGTDGLMSMFNMFSGGALTQMSIFALGVMPYISASIIFQMLSAVYPKFIEMKKEGESGQKKITQYTRYLTLGLAIVQSFGIVAFVLHQNGLVTTNNMGLFYLTTVVSVTTGSMFLMWLGEQITERGVGNGISLLIFSGIVANLPFEISNILSIDLFSSSIGFVRELDTFLSSSSLFRVVRNLEISNNIFFCLSRGSKIS